MSKGRPFRHPFSNSRERDLTMLRMLDEGMTLKGVGQALGYQPTSVRAYARRGARLLGRPGHWRGHPSKRGDFPTKRARDTWIYNQWRWGLKKTTIAYLLDMSPEQVSSIVRFLDALENRERVCFEAQHGGPLHV